MSNLHRRASLLAASLALIALAATACGDDKTGGSAAGFPPGTTESPANDSAAVRCPLDAAGLTSAIGITMKQTPAARCGFVAESPQPGQVIEIYYAPIDAMIYDGSEGESVAGVGDGARWDTQMSNSLLVKTGSRYFSVQAVAMGDLPEKLRAKNLAVTVAHLVLRGSGQ